MADTNINKPPHRTFATHLIAEEFGSRTYADWEIKYEWLALARIFRIVRLLILCVQAVEHADDRLLDDNPQIDLGLICLGHSS